MIEIISGIVTAIAIIIVALMLSRYVTMKLFAATILVAIAFIYVGYSLKGENTIGLIILEVAVTLIFYFIAVIGYTRNSLLIAYGIILHGVWDILHHNGLLVKTDIPEYWASFCLVVDIIDGLFFVYIFRRQKNSKRIPENKM
jgi:hypothetical protein